MAMTDECPCPVTNSTVVVNRRKFKELGPEGHRLIWLWFKRASEELPSDPFPSLIYAWIAINGWAACCTGKDSDKILVDAMASDPFLNSEFEALLQDPAYRQSAEEFRDQWPIFKAATLRRQRERRNPHSRRRKVVERYLAQYPSIARAPQCYGWHVEKGDSCPLDLAHTLAAIYRVRCNLFHGEKCADSRQDKSIVSAAAHTLVPFLERLLKEDSETSDQPDTYYQEWASRLNVTPDLVAEAERIAGTPIGDMMAEDSDIPLPQVEDDARLIGTAMARHGADGLSELADAMHPDDDGYAELRAALQRVLTIMILDEGQE